jgi:hypothetical protein
MSGLQAMGSYIFERNGERDGQEAGNLAADVELALAELAWVDSVSVRSGDGVSAVADVHFDPDWPDQANADLAAEVFARYGIHIVDANKNAGKVSATDPLHASASVDDGGIDLFVFDE